MLNWPLISNPMNWIIVLLMVILGHIAIHQIIRFGTEAKVIEG